MSSLRAPWGTLVLVTAVASCQGTCGQEPPAANDAAPPLAFASASAAPAPAPSAAAAPEVDASGEAVVVADASPAAPSSTSPIAAADAGRRKTPCPNVPVPSKGRYDACAASGGKLTPIETDGCVRGYDCVK